MNKKDFTYNYYFEKFKETSVLCHEAFKKRFKDKYPNTKIDLRKLLIEIEKYQINKYGTIKFSDMFIDKPTYTEKKKMTIADREKKRRKFGTKEERRKRAIVEKYK